MSVRSIAALALAAVAVAAAPRTAAAGPPWIAVELPANPHLEATRGALAVVRVYHHGTATPYPLQAEAVGLVDGARRTVRLEARPAGVAGVYAVHGALPAGDGWVLVMTTRTGPTARASALVALDRRLEVAGVRVPADLLEGGRWTNPREATAADVEALLRVATATRVAASDGPEARVATAGVALVGVLLLPMGVRRLRGGADRSHGRGVRGA
jgi:hypothetical protein